jgi:hypothetical protein
MPLPRERREVRREEWTAELIAEYEDRRVTGLLWCVSLCRISAWERITTPLARTTLERVARRNVRTAFASAAERALVSERSAVVVGLLGFAAAVAAALAPAATTSIAVSALAFAVAGILLAVHLRSRVDGPYQLLKHASVWDLDDPQGLDGWHTKRNLVRFNYATSVVQERAWTDLGLDPFSSFDAEYGTLVGTQVVDGRHVGAILLSNGAARGDERVLVSRRRLTNSFPGETESIEFELSQRCPSLSMEVRFPAARPPTAIRLTTARRRGRVMTVDVPTHELETVGGRPVLRLAAHDPRGIRSYMLTWTWRPLLPSTAANCH